MIGSVRRLMHEPEGQGYGSNEGSYAGSPPDDGTTQPPGNQRAASPETEGR